MAVMEEESPSSSSAWPRKSRPDAASSNHSYYLAKTILRSSVVLQVVRGHIRSPCSVDVVFGKETSIELVIFDEDGNVQSVSEQPVFGTIKDLAVLPWNESFCARSPKILGKDLLVVISDSGKLSFLTFCSEMHRFSPLSHIQLSPPGNMRAEVGRMLAVDSNGCFVAASAFHDKVALLPVSTSSCSDIVDKKIVWPPENASIGRGDTGVFGTIWSMCFISKDLHQQNMERNPLLAMVVNRRRSFRNELLLVEWDLRNEAAHVMFQYSDAGPLAHHIVEVPNCFGFAFLFRAGDALLMDFRDCQKPCVVCKSNLDFTSNAVEGQNFAEATDIVDIPDIIDEEGIHSVAASALLELSDLSKSVSMDIDVDTCTKPGSNYVCSWSWEPTNDNNWRMIFSADSGDLFMLEIFFDADGVKVNMSESIYKGLPFQALLWVEGGFLAAIVEMGDGMVLKLGRGCLYYKSPIQNISPILDMVVVDYSDEKRDQMFACCGMANEGSLRIIRSGISMDKLLRTGPNYQGIAGTWALKLKVTDSFHSFLVISFVEETRVLSVGLSFYDVTDSVGFLTDVCTLACGLVTDGLLAQIHKNAVRLCLPVKPAGRETIPLGAPICSSWSPGNMKISLGAVGSNLIVVATSSPFCLFFLGIRSSAACCYEIFQMHQVRLQNELSCISIPRSSFEKGATRVNFSSSIPSAAASVGSAIDNLVIIGTHKPSVEILLFAPDTGLQVLAIGPIFLTNAVGTVIGGCIPQDVRLVIVDRPYILAGLRNGMLLRFEWPPMSAVSLPEASSSLVNSAALGNIASSGCKSSVTWMFDSFEKTKQCFPVHLHIIAARRIGITPAFLIPLSDALDADIIALSDRPWLLHTARHSLSYTSISFEPSTHVTPVCSVECPKGILFVADNSLHLAEMEPSKRLNVQKFSLGGTPRKILYHSDRRLLFVLRTDLRNDSYSSDVCCVDPISGSVLSTFKFEPGETGKCMDLVKVGQDFVLVVGTSLSAGPGIMPSGEAESTKGRLVVLCLEHVQNSDAASMSFSSRTGSFSQRSSPLRENDGIPADQVSGDSLCSSPSQQSGDGLKLDECEAWHLRLAYSSVWPGMVLAVCPYLDHYFLASAGNTFYVCSFPDDNAQRVKRWAAGRTRFMIMTLTTHDTRIAVGDCRDGILFYSYLEDARKLEQLYCDPVQRLVADCILMDVDTAVVSDRKGSIAVLSCLNHLEDNASPESNLTLNTSYYMGETAMCIRKGSFSYKLPADDMLRGYLEPIAIHDLPHNSIMVSSLLGSVITFLPLSWGEYEILESVQARVAVHPLTAPILGNNHEEYRSRESSGRSRKMLDGDMLAQFLDLTSLQQEAVLALPLSSTNKIMLSTQQPPPPITANQVVRLLERVHYALN